MYQILLNILQNYKDNIDESDIDAIHYYLKGKYYEPQKVKYIPYPIHEPPAAPYPNYQPD